MSHISSGESTEWKSLIVSLASAFVSMFCKEQGITVLVSKSLNISYRTKASMRQHKCDHGFFLFWPDVTLISYISSEYNILKRHLKKARVINTFCYLQLCLSIVAILFITK